MGFAFQHAQMVISLIQLTWFVSHVSLHANIVQYLQETAQDAIIHHQILTLKTINAWHHAYQHIMQMSWIYASNVNLLAWTAIHQSIVPHAKLDTYTTLLQINVSLIVFPIRFKSDRNVKLAKVLVYNAPKPQLTAHLAFQITS